MLLAVLGGLLLLPLVLLLAAWIWFRVTHRHLISQASRIPSVLPTVPVLGSAHLVFQLGVGKMGQAAMDAMLEAVARGVTATCFWCGPLPLVIIHGYEDIQKILNSSTALNKSDEMRFFDYAAKDGLMTAKAEVWKITRKNANPMFHPRNVDRLLPRLNRNGRDLVDRLGQLVGRGAVDVLPPAMTTALQSVCHLIYGPTLDVDVDTQEFHGLMIAVERMPELFMKRVSHIWLRSDKIFQYLHKNDLEEINQGFRQFTIAALKAIKNDTGQLNDLQNGNEQNNGYNEGPINLLNTADTLHKNYPQFSKDYMFSEMATIYAAGTDTVGATIATFMLALAQFPDIQDKVHEELVSVLGPDDDVTTDIIHGLRYFDQVYKEILRWSTAAPFVLRKSSKDLKLSSCTIPAGFSAVLSLRSLLMDPNTFPDPLRFDPERFAPHRFTDEMKQAFLPFGGGPRNCIGKAFATLVVKVVIAHVVRHYTLSTTEDINRLKRKISVVYVGNKGYHVSVQHRL